jgi:hypothetical protein
LLALHAQNLHRQEAAVMRAQAGAERDQAEVARQEAGTERAQLAMLPDPSKRIEAGKVLRQQAWSALEALAISEEDIAKIYEELAARHLEHREEYRRSAEQGRARARSVRKALRTFPD